MKMGLFKKENKEVRVQGSLIPMGETSTKGNYISNIIKHKFYDYYNIEHRRAVCKLDPIGKKLTYKWANRVTAKTFKFYSSHEVDAEEVMQEIRAKWVELNCNEILKKAIVPMVEDGYALLELTNKNNSIDYNVYGEYECPPKLWWTDVNNKIIGYQVQFTPHPRAIGSAATMLNLSNRSTNMRAINRTLYPKDVIHVEYGEPNYGCGDPLIEAAWDSILKLCGQSHQEMMDSRSIPTLHLTEDDYDAQHTKAKENLKMVANSDQDTARVWYHKQVKGTKEVLDYPKFAYESPTSNPAYNTRNQNQGISTGDFGNISKEWARLTTVTGHSIHYFVGNRAGAVTGSETDKTEDDEQEIIDFGLLESLIRKILDWLAAQGFITMPTESFVIKYWKDWEKIELKAKNKEEMPMMANPTQPAPDKELEVDSQDNTPNKEKDKTSNKANEAITIDILNCMRNNMSYPMTDVMSSWIDQIGYDDATDLLYMMTLTGDSYSKPAPMGEWSIEDWHEAGSKGEYFWNYLSQRDPPWTKATIPEKLLSHFEKQEETVKIPIMDYNIINSVDTEGKIKKLGKEIKWSMGTTTATNIKEMLNSLKTKVNTHQLRHNTMNATAFGNSIKEKHPLLYDIGNGVIVEEYICPEAWKKNVGKTVPLGVYHNLEWNDPELLDWQVVGNAEIFGWDDENGEDFVKWDYDYDKINAIFERLNQYDWLTPSLKDTGTSDISTAYYCDIEYRWIENLKKFIRVQVNIDLVSISFVPRGNCPGEVCSIKEVKGNMDAMQKYIKDCIAEGTEKEQCLAKAYKKFKEVK